MKESAEKAMNAYMKDMEKVLDEEVELDVLRLIKVCEGDIKKDVINAHDIYILLPFFDLKEVGGAEEPTTPSGDEGESD